jgi:hypothetical protein
MPLEPVSSTTVDAAQDVFLRGTETSATATLKLTKNLLLIE